MAAPTISNVILKNEKAKIELKQIRAQKILDKKIQEFNESLLEANLDESLNKLFETQIKNIKNEKAFKEFQNLIEEYTNELKKNNKLTDEQLNEIQKLMHRTKVIKKAAVVEKAIENINQDFSIGGLYTAFKTKTAGKYIKEQFKRSLTPSGIVKTLLHGAGVTLDIPALNIVASELGNFSSENKEYIEALKEVADQLPDKAPDKQLKPKKTEEQKLLSDINEQISTSQKEIDKELLKKSDEQIKKLDDLNKNSSKLIKKIDNLIFYQKDVANDKKLADLKSTKKVDTAIAKDEREKRKEEQKGSILDLFDTKRRRGRLSKPGRSGKLGRFGKLGGLLRFPKIGLGTAGAAEAGMAGLFTSPLAIGALLASIGYLGYQGFKKTKETFGLKESQKATLAQETSAIGGGIASGLTFGLIDQKEATKKIHKAKDWISETGIIGGIRRLTTDKKAYEVAERLEEQGVVDLSVIGDSQIRDWDAIKRLKPQEIDALIKYDDWDKSTLDRLKAIKKSKEKPKEDFYIRTTLRNMKKRDNSSRYLKKQQISERKQKLAKDGNLKTKTDATTIKENKLLKLNTDSNTKSISESKKQQTNDVSIQKEIVAAIQLGFASMQQMIKQTPQQAASQQITQPQPNIASIDNYDIETMNIMEYLISKGYKV